MPQEWYQYHRGPRVFEWARGAINRHSGIDLQAPCGTPVTAPVDGTVLNSGVHPWGGQIDVLSPNLPGYEPGSHVVTFLHTSAQYVHAGERVTAGQVLGASGQPPPGAGYGGGCHIHFEVTRGAIAPYTTYSPGRNPSAVNYPESPVALLDNVAGGHIGAQAQFQPAAGDCGAEPQRSAFPAGADGDAAYTVVHDAWVTCTSAAIGNPLDPIGQALSSIADFFATLPTKLAGLLIRGAKVVFGGALIILGLALAFREDLAAGAATAIGVPELAGAARRAAGGGPSGIVRGGIRGLATIPGEQRQARRQVERERAARANANDRAARATIARAFAVQEREGKRVERARRTTAKIRPTPTPPPTAGPSGNAGRASGQPSRPTARVRYGSVKSGPHSKPLATSQRGGRFGGLGPTPAPETDEQRAQRESNTRGLKFHIAQTRNRRVRSVRKTRVQTARALPSVQNQPERAAAAKRAVARAIKRRRTGA